MSKKLPDASSSSGFRQTLLKSSALSRALAAVLTAAAAVGWGVQLTIAPVRDGTQQLTSKWKWLFFGSALVASFMAVICLKFYMCLREIDTERRRRGIRLFIITCVVMALLELAIGGLAFTDSRTLQTRDIEGELRGSPEWVSFSIVYCLCLLLVVQEILSIIVALTCVRSQLYEQIASAKASNDIVEFERRPSSAGGVEEMDFSIEKIDDETTETDEAENQPLQPDAVDNGSSEASQSRLVNNELYGVPEPMKKRPKQVPPPLPPVKYDEVNADRPPPIPTSPIPDEVDHPSSPRSPTFPRYERRSRGGTPGASPIFPRYVDTSFAHYNPQLGTFLRPFMPPDESAKPVEQQQQQQAS